MRYSLLLLLSLFGSMLSAQAPKTKSTDSISSRLENSLLWEISGKGIKKSYVFGTIHMISEQDFFLSESTKKAIKKCKKLVMEIDMSQSMQTAMQLMMLAPMKDGKTLSDVMSAEDYQLTKDYFTKDAKSTEAKMMPFEMIEKWKPMLLQSFLYQDMIEGPMKAYEMELLSIGTAQKMSFDGLETVEDQVAVFEKIPYEDQAKALIELIKEIKKGENSGKEEFKKLVDLYKAQDIDGMVEISSEEFFDSMENGEAELLTNRNKKWIPKIIAFSKEKTTFYAVGAAHLGGPNGVIRLLIKEGYKVKAVK
jgi:uncharacterized protein YbaP (TraB family)